MNNYKTPTDGQLIINDDTDIYSLWTPTVDGEVKGRGLHYRDYEKDAFGDFATPFPSSMLIDPDEWDERIEEKDRKKTWIADIVKAKGMRSKDQQRTNYCWIFATTSVVQATRIYQGYDHMELSPASVGGPMTNYRNVGGWSTQGMREGAEIGWAPSEMWPDTGIDRQYDTEAVRQVRKAIKLQEWWEARARAVAEEISMLLRDIACACGYNWWGHAVFIGAVTALGNRRYGRRGLNSWGESYGNKGWFNLEGSRAISDDCCGPRSSA